ncbi:protein sorting system archaetidylserine synthase [Halococcus sp. IIIV-5B]|uniref:protein sorting system archaetidylserine synthase n=1 Tax=Halococcus sp. IIIV-5B TaxID=2321230 RepID=UPI000E733228|nr:protein sorting system archaetidylserine synthase [Halococcus sp. IIIV-5B]RJT03878.1 phosphatidylcholine/phosphatidylserine synthase [Halococcus sp. IIIV-5B]
MPPRPRFVARLGLADAVTATNAGLGFLAAAAAPFAPALAARLILLAAVADGLDGVLAAHTGGTPLGEFLDSLADVASFTVAPALLVFGVMRRAWELSFVAPTPALALALVVPAAFVVVGVVRLGLYTAYDIDRGTTEGVPTTLAATVLAAAFLAGVRDPVVVLLGLAAFVALMVAPVGYPDLRMRDALAMGVVQAGAILAPALFFRVFPRLLCGFALAYLVLGPRYYPLLVEGKRT